MSDSPDSLFRQLAAAEPDDKLPPVHLWHPEETKDIGMRVTRDGTWWYQGSPIRRQRLVRLFSRVLRREGADYFLVTPVEKVKVEVEVAPLLAVRMDVRGGPDPEIVFETNMGDLIVADDEQALCGDRRLRVVALLEPAAGHRRMRPHRPGSPIRWSWPK